MMPPLSDVNIACRAMGKKIKGRKRHIVTDTLGFMVGLVVHSAGIQDRDGAPEVLKLIRGAYPDLRHIFADGGYAGPKLRGALEGAGNWTIQIVKRSDKAEGFEVIPRPLSCFARKALPCNGWVVERSLGP
jgi:putative transposase